MRNYKTADRVHRFIGPDERTADYERAVAAIRALIKRADLDVATRAFAEAAAEERLEKWRQHGYTQFNGHACVGRILNMACQRDFLCGPCALPHADHLTMWCRDNEPCALVSQPYHLYWEQLCDLVEFARQWNLRIDIDAERSWYFPGYSLFVLVQPNNGQ